jgi:hypothetical protein
MRVNRTSRKCIIPGHWRQRNDGRTQGKPRGDLRRDGTLLGNVPLGAPDNAWRVIRQLDAERAGHDTLIIGWQFIILGADANSTVPPAISHLPW